MKNIFLKIFIYTLALTIVIDLFKIFVQNPFFKEDYNCQYNILMFLFKFILFLFTLYLLKVEKIKISKFNQNKYVLGIIAIAIFFKLYQNVHSESIASKIEIDYIKLVFYSLNNLFIGLFEEFYFRLLVFLLLCEAFKNNLFKNSILTSFLFAIVHISNFFLESYTVNDILFQVLFAFGTGLFFQIILINSKNIYITVLLHAFIDFNSNFSEKFFNTKIIEDLETGFDYHTLIILSIIILFSLTIAFFNLKRKDSTYFSPNSIS